MIEMSKMQPAGLTHLAQRLRRHTNTIRNDARPTVISDLIAAADVIDSVAKLLTDIQSGDVAAAVASLFEEG